jgi:hypothetical protein
MASRPIFVPKIETSSPGVEEKIIEFTWHAGMAKVQKQKSIRSLHASAAALGYEPLLEISSKSEDSLGIRLSAFNLLAKPETLGLSFSVETAFQSSKVFEYGGPFTDLLDKTSREAKRDLRLKESGRLIGFRYFDTNFPLQPRTFFYDWLYLNALNRLPDIGRQLLPYSAFSDIEFNPKKSINCQASSAALFVSLRHHDVIATALESPDNFMRILADHYGTRDNMVNLQQTLI